MRTWIRSNSIYAYNHWQSGKGNGAKVSNYSPVLYKDPPAGLTTTFQHSNGIIILNGRGVQYQYTGPARILAGIRATTNTATLDIAIPKISFTSGYVKCKLTMVAPDGFNYAGYMDLTPLSGNLQYWAGYNGDSYKSRFSQANVRYTGDLQARSSSSNMISVNGDSYLYFDVASEGVDLFGTVGAYLYFPDVTTPITLGDEYTATTFYIKMEFTAATADEYNAAGAIY